MTSARSRPEIAEATLKPLVCIDAQDTYYITPLREYFTSHGCEVVVNQPTDTVPTYHLICGEDEFVKNFFLRLPHDDRQYLLLIWQGSLIAAQALASDNTKVVLLEAKPLSESQVFALFTFFFTSPAKILDWRSPTTSKREEVKLSRGELGSAAGENLAVVARPKAVNLPHSYLAESDTRRVSETIAAVFGKEKQAKPKLVFLKQRPIFLGMLMGVLLIGLPFFWYVTSLTLSVVSLGLGAKWLAAGKTRETMSVIKFSDFWREQGRGVLKIVSGPLGLTGRNRQVQGQEQVISFLQETTLAQRGMVRILIGGRQLANALLVTQEAQTVTPPHVAASLEKLRLEVVDVQNHLGLAYAQLKRFLAVGTFPFSLSPAQDFGGRGLKVLAQLRAITGQIDNLLLLLPLVGGFREKQIYLVLLQNDAELRPTGGFIGSLALVTLEEGRVSDLNIQDVYAVDGQLKGHVDPPGPIREILGQEHWYLRDSNWDPDFRESAARAAWFFEKETGIRVDGVIGINSRLIIELLKATGPLELADYNDRVSSENFFGKSLFYTQTDFFPGSTQKKDFLGSLASALIAKLTSGRGVAPAAIFRAISTGFVRHDILFYFPQPNLQAIVEQANWAGRIKTRDGCGSSSDQPCFWDPVIFNEANLGVNKANYFVKRVVNLVVAIGEDGIPTETLTLTYRNTSTAEPAAGGGIYRAYVRLIMPSDSQVSLVTLDGAKVPQRDESEKKPPSWPYFEIEEEARGRGLGVALAVPPAGVSRLTLTFRRSFGVVFGSGGGSYELFIPKQPGAGDTPGQIVIKYPIFWAAIREREFSRPIEGQEFLAKPGVLEYNTTLSQDQNIRIKFLK
ncbi:MAG: DUF4012 domain-containing protein [Patescibacteria group bacterium]